MNPRTSDIHPSPHAESWKHTKLQEWRQVELRTTWLPGRKSGTVQKPRILTVWLETHNSVLSRILSQRITQWAINQNHRHGYLNKWSPVNSPFMEVTGRLGNGAWLPEVRHKGRALRVYSFLSFPSSSLCFLCVVVVMQSLGFVLYPPSAMRSLLSWTHRSK